MTPVEQRELFDAEAGTTGDCWKCCIASVLDLPYESVPHFVKDEIEGRSESWWNATQDFIREHGYVVACFGLWGDERPFLMWGSQMIRYAFHAPGHWIAEVKSPRYMEGGEPGGHVVVMHGDHIAFDPHPRRDDGHLGFTEAYLLVRP